MFTNTSRVLLAHNGILHIGAASSPYNNIADALTFERFQEVRLGAVVARIQPDVVSGGAIRAAGPVQAVGAILPCSTHNQHVMWGAHEM